MNKTELLEKLRTAVQTERAASIATRNIIATFTWSGLDENTMDEVSRTLETLAARHGERASTLNRLAAEIERSPQDVF